MKRILYVSHRFPYPPDKGDKIRSFNEVKYLSKNNLLDIVTFVDNSKDYEYEEHLKKYCNELYIFPIRRLFFMFKAAFHFLFGKTLSEGYYFSRKVQKKVKELLFSNNYDLVFCYSSQIAQFIVDKNIPKLIDFCDVDSLKWKQYGERKIFPVNVILKIEGERLSRREKEIYNQFNLSLFSTSTEVKFFNLPKNNHIYVLPNGVDYEYFKPQTITKENRLIFFGTMDYFANVDGVVWFSKSVFPKIITKHAEIKFYIVGRNPDPQLVELSNDNKNIIVTGYVKDMRPYIAQSKLAVVPLRIARGIQNKILEAMAMEIPVVIPRDIFNTFENLVENDVLVYDDEQSMADLIMNTVNNDPLLKKMGKNLRKYVMVNHDWNMIFSKFDEFLYKQSILDSR